MKIFVICSVRGMDDEHRKKLEDHIAVLEQEGHTVHLPHRDTDQEDSGLESCSQNLNAIEESDEVHIFYSSKSQGIHFDMGCAFALGKCVKIIESEPYDPIVKSFTRMLNEWQSSVDGDEEVE